jgi:putative spermidine/putrescine transport system substrate-binding protein
MAWMPSGQIVAQQKAGNDLGIVWNQAVNYPWGALPVPNGAPNAEGMFALADFMAQPEREAEFAKLTGYGPPNPKALSLLDSATLAYVANSPQNLKVAVEVDTVALSKETVGYAESYGEWLAS